MLHHDAIQVRLYVDEGRLAIVHLLHEGLEIVVVRPHGRGILQVRVLIIRRSRLQYVVINKARYIASLPGLGNIVTGVVSTPCLPAPSRIDTTCQVLVAVIIGNRGMHIGDRAVE
jgi:hypothetical protein